MTNLSALPAAPDFTALAHQQAGLNAGVANAATLANRPNQSNQNGMLSWTQGPGGEWTQTQSLSAPNQALWGNYTAGMGDLASTLGSGDWGNTDVTRGVYSMPQSGFGASQQVIDAMRGLQAPQLGQARDAERARMAAMGLTLGSAASNSSEDALGRTANDADLKAILAGTQEFGNVFNRGLQSRQQGVDENFKSQNLLQALRGQQTSTLGALGSARSGLDPKFAEFRAASTAPAPDVYGAGVDQYRAQLDALGIARANQNAVTQSQANNRAGNMGLLGTGIGALLGNGGGQSMLQGIRGMFGGGDGGYDQSVWGQVPAGTGEDFLGGDGGYWGVGGGGWGADLGME